jgi:AmiR/NasT family two-component response regulator
MWSALHSLLSGSPKHSSAATPVIALAVSDHDREILTAISGREPWEIHLAESRVQAWDAMNRFNSPVILYDRDWPGAEWRSTVQTFARSAQRPCVLLTSRVADEYLWQELIRCGGHDLLAKPLRSEDVTRALKLAYSYWTNARAPVKR